MKHDAILGCHVATRQNGTNLLAGLVLIAAILHPQQTFALGPPQVNLGSAAHFAILAGSTITTTGGGLINGDVGLFPVGSEGIPQSQINGTIYDGGPIAEQAQADLNTAVLASSPPELTGGINAGNELGGQTLAPGVYLSPSGAYGITLVDLTLNGGSNDVWVFQMSTTLTVGVGRQVILTGGAQARNVFWQVGTSATLGASSTFEGTIMASASITMNALATLDGRALAQNGAVTFDGSRGNLPLPAPPIFTAITSVSTNSATSATVVLSTTAYLPLTLQTSSNLLTWTTIATNTPATNVWTYTDSVTSNMPQRYYRASISRYP